MKYYKNIICGAGPAGMGVIIRAAATGRLAELADSGLVLIDRQSKFGVGAIASYNVEANTPASVFLEVVERADEDSCLNSVRRLSAYQILSAFGERPPPLPVVARLQRDIAFAVLSNLRAHPRVRLIRKTPLQSLHICDRGIGVVTGDRNQGRWIGSNVFLNLGGTERLPSVLHAGNRTVACLWECQPKAEFGTKLLALSDRALRSFVGSNSRLAFIGCSHTTFALLARIKRVLPPRQFDMTEVRIFSSHGPKFYAQVANPDTNLANICPVTGRVNRFGGLRFSAASIASEILAGEHPKMSVHIVDATTDDEWVRRILAEASKVVFACGFVPRRPQIYKENGSEVQSAFDLPYETLANSSDARLVANSNIFSWGIGNGPRPDAELGGEPSLSGRIEGIWVYQHVLADRMLSKALATTEGN